MGVGGKRVAGSGGLGEWVGNGRSDGRRRGGCGPGMPGPYGVAEGCAGPGRKGARVWGGFGPSL